MDTRRKNAIKLATAGVLLSAAAVLGVMRWRSSLASGEDGAKSFFFDPGAKRLYAAPRDTIPPDEPSGGVRAVVVAPRNSKENSNRRRIAYLETYTPPLKEKLDAVRAARKAGRGSEIKGPKGDDAFVLKNTLVRRDGEETWHDMTTKEGQKIVGEWTAWRDDAGKPLVVVTP